MSPRDRRLRSDLQQMEELARDGEVAFVAEGDPPERYRLMFTSQGLCEDARGELALRGLHRCEVYLHREYPRRPPIVTWLTPIFHPNILGPDRNGGVCIGSWSAAESLADLCRRLCDLVSYRAFNPADALNLEAAAWALRHEIRPGAPLVDLKDLPVERGVHVGGLGGA